MLIVWKSSRAVLNLYSVSKTKQASKAITNSPGRDGGKESSKKEESKGKNIIRQKVFEFP